MGYSHWVREEVVTFLQKPNPYRPEQLESSLRTLVERDMRQGLIIDTSSSPPERLDSNGHIEYPSGNRLEWTKADEGLAKGFYFDYKSGKRTVRLNDLVKYGQWVFIPVKSRFQVFLRHNEGVRSYGEFCDYDDPEIHLSIPCLEQSELEILAALHEVGHARFYNEVHEAVQRKKLLPLNRGTYGRQLADVHALLDCLFNPGHTEISEIMAWRSAIRDAWGLGILQQFSETEKAGFIRERLGSYLVGFARAVWTG